MLRDISNFLADRFYDVRYSVESSKLMHPFLVAAISKPNILYIQDIDHGITWIPKNGCSSLKLALENSDYRCFYGFLGVNKINSQTKISLITRHPYDRLVSLYLDKVVELKIPFWRPYFDEMIKYSKGCEQLTFENFVYALARGNLIRRGDHTYPQTSFCLYSNPSKYTSIYDISTISSLYEKLDLSASSYTFQSPDGYKGAMTSTLLLKKVHIQDAWKCPGYKLLNQKINHAEIPRAENFRAPHLQTIVQKLYQKDYENFNY